MNTKIIMTVSSVIMGIVGIMLTFAPGEILKFMGDAQPQRVIVIALQMAGALYFGFAMINWTAKANLIGGIYGRPIAIGNLTHFFVGAMALMKGGHLALLPLTIIYSVMATAFLIVFVTHPIKEINSPVPSKV